VKIAVVYGGAPIGQQVCVLFFFPFGFICWLVCFGSVDCDLLFVCVSS
jgi:hypothetical protein